LPPCLYCKRESGSYTSEEHVVAEGLGNRELVLPKGVVCDKCNHEKLSTLDNTLIDFAPIKAIRTRHGIPSKTGALPKSKFGNASLEMFAPGNVLFQSNSPKAFQVRQVEGGDPNQVMIDMSFLSNRPMGARYSRQLTRALLKMLLGCIYLDDTELAFSEKFDPMRDKILDRTKFRGYFAMLRNIQNPNSQGVGLIYDFFKDEAGNETVGVEFQFYGVTMSTDSEMFGRNSERMPKDQVIIFRF
jgi:hypothetical protein